MNFPDIDDSLFPESSYNFKSPFQSYPDQLNENNPFFLPFNNLLNDPEFLSNIPKPNQIIENKPNKIIETKTKNTTYLSKKLKREEFNIEKNEIKKECEIKINNKNIQCKANKIKQGRKKLNEKIKGNHTKEKYDNKLRKIKTGFGNKSALLGSAYSHYPFCCSCRRGMVSRP